MGQLLEPRSGTLQATGQQPKNTAMPERGGGMQDRTYATSRWTLPTCPWSGDPRRSKESTRWSKRNWRRRHCKGRVKRAKHAAPLTDPRPGSRAGVGTGRFSSHERNVSRMLRLRISKGDLLERFHTITHLHKPTALCYTGRNQVRRCMYFCGTAQMLGGTAYLKVNTFDSERWYS